MSEWQIGEANQIACRQVVAKIVSGGQTGVDRAALDWAIRHGIPHGGWCPRGRIAEDGVLDGCYALRESTCHAQYHQRRPLNSVPRLLFKRKQAHHVLSML